ncbi:MAG: S9 family peptidase [Anaerolineales bacterium]|nr:S9 family peptidase [Anaerolineales bacterium]
MTGPILEKYEYSGQPSLARPDLHPPEGWSLALVASVQRIYNHRLSPDGGRIAFFWHREDLADLYVLPAAGGWPQRMTTDRPSLPYWQDETPQWSPDGCWLAFSSGEHVRILDSRGGLSKKLQIPLQDSASPVWLADNDRLVVAATVDETPRLYLTDRAGSFARALTREPGSDFDARPSPDCRSVAFVRWPDDDLNRRDIRLVDLESGETRLLSGLPATKEWSPRWSPDGQWLAFLSQRTEFSQVWLVRADGRDLHQLTDEGREVNELAWSPDGARLACTVNRGGRRELVLFDVQTGSRSELRGGDGIHAHPNWSPDGRFITVEYESPVQPPEVCRVDLADGRLTPLTFSLPPALARNPLVMPEEVKYKSADGAEIPALLFKPARPNGAALVNPHGGPAEQYEFYWDIFPQYLAAKGYTLLMPNYRGSTGFGRTFEHKNYGDWGGGDVQDCLSAADFLRGLPGIDPARIGIFGESFGAYLTNCCLAADPDRFACGVSIYGDADLFTSWAQCNGFIRRYTEMQMGHPAANRKAYEAGTIIARLAGIRKPLLLLHGLEDDIVPPQASEELARELRRLGKVFEYKTYAGEPHGFQKRANLLDALERMERFFDWYLLPAPVGRIGNPTYGWCRTNLSICPTCPESFAA